MHRFSRRILFTALLLSGFWSLMAPAFLRGDEGEENLPEFWVDDDIEKGLSRARKTGKPLLVVFRCPP